jgi:transposase
MAPEFFLNPTHPMQRRYEALRASFVEGLSAHEVAKKFGYSVHTVNALRRDFKAGLLQPFFLPLARGPKSPRPATAECKERIIALRKQNYSIGEIEEVLLREGQTISAKTIHLLLQAEGFARLFRRTRAERRERLCNEPKSRRRWPTRAPSAPIGWSGPPLAVFFSFFPS